MQHRHLLLSSASLAMCAMGVSLPGMTPSERRVGRFLRAEEGHTPAPENIEEVTQFQAPNNAAPEAERPADLPEGFDSWEAYGKAKLAEGNSQDGEQAADADADGTKPEALDADTQKAIDTQVDSLPEDRREAARPFFEEFARTGDLSEAQRDEAAKAFGVTRDMVDIYVSGAKGQAAEEAGVVYADVGGKEVVDAFTTWAQDNYTPEQKAAYNEALGKDATQAVKDAVALWQAEGHAVAKDITRANLSGGGQSTTYEGYASVEEQTAAQSDPRYARDPAYRATVEAKIGKTDFNLSRQS